MIVGIFVWRLGGIRRFIFPILNAFTAFFLSEVTFDGHVFKVGQALSGNIVERGIENFQQINTVIDDAGHPGNFLVSKNTGDLFVDLNGLSKRVAAAAASDTK